MSRHFTSATSLENLKREAKRWLRELREGSTEARARFDRALPNAPAEPTLRDVQLAIAREYGLPGWSDVKRRLEHGAPSVVGDETMAWFFTNACPDHHVRGGPAHLEARHITLRLLERHPTIRTHDLYAAVACGELATVRRILDDDPAIANRRGGAKGWEPLLYLTFSRVPVAEAADNALDIAALLLDRGADPNVHFMAGDSRYTPLVGAVGQGEEGRPAHPRRDELVRLLLERGANPYDIQVLYNIHFEPDSLWFLKLAYEFSVNAGHAADWAEPTWAMLGMGGYGPGAHYVLAMALRHNDLELARWALEHGASPNVMTSTHPKFRPTNTLYDEAFRSGRSEIAALLRAYGAEGRGTAMTPDAELLLACIAGDRAKAEELVRRHPTHLTATNVVFQAAKKDRADVVALLLDLGMSPDVENAKKERPLHMAAYSDSVNVGRLLIERGAEIDPVELNWNNTPIDAAIYSQAHGMIDLLAPVSRDLFSLAYAGKVDRLRDLFAVDPSLARTMRGTSSLLMWLPPHDEEAAVALVRLLLSHGVDPKLVSDEGFTAADYADRLGLTDAAELLREAMT